MNLLLDTHTLLWWLDDNPTLSKPAHDAISKAENQVFISAVSAWEIAIKKKLGKLRASDNLEKELIKHRFQPLPITILHAMKTAELPNHHHDPFDRMLVAQALTERLTLVTRDNHIQKYDIHFIPA